MHFVQLFVYCMCSCVTPRWWSKKHFGEYKYMIKYILWMCICWFVTQYKISSYKLAIMWGISGEPCDK